MKEGRQAEEGRRGGENRTEEKGKKELHCGKRQKSNSSARVPNSDGKPHYLETEEPEFPPHSKVNS